jgi:hypothetical protein
LAKHVSTPLAMRVWTRLSAPFIGVNLESSREFAVPDLQSKARACPSNPPVILPSRRSVKSEHRVL